MKLQVKFKERRFPTAGLPLPVLGITTLLEEFRPLEPVSFAPVGRRREDGGRRVARTPKTSLANPPSPAFMAL